MRLELPDFSPHATLAAVLAGALVATASGVIATQVEAFFQRRERERWAALLFGEIFSTVRILIEGADASRAIGPAYGPVTRRMLGAARREIEIYERNREALMDLRDARLRADMHGLAVRLAMPLDGILDSLGPDNQGADAVRDRAFGFLKATLANLPPLVDRLGRLARHRFDYYDAMPRPGATLPTPPGAAEDA
jgi:hypothetical protein